MTDFPYTGPVQDLTPAVAPLALAKGHIGDVSDGQPNAATLAEAVAAAQVAAADRRGVVAAVVSGDLTDPAVLDDLRGQLEAQQRPLLPGA